MITFYRKAYDKPAIPLVQMGAQLPIWGMYISVIAIILFLLNWDIEDTGKRDLLIAIGVLALVNGHIFIKMSEPYGKLVVDKNSITVWGYALGGFWVAATSHKYSLSPETSHLEIKELEVKHNSLLLKRHSFYEIYFVSKNLPQGSRKIRLRQVERLHHAYRYAVNIIPQINISQSLTIEQNLQGQFEEIKISQKLDDFPVTFS